jgi:hypothetical protein
MDETHDNTWQPEPAELAAYVDGHLDARRHREVEAWLSEHPDVAAELHAHRRLERLWRRTAPDSPTPARWSLVRLNIFAGLADRSAAVKSPSRWWIVPLALGTVAAGTLLALVLFRDYLPLTHTDRSTSASPIGEVGIPKDDKESKPEKVEAFKVLSDDEVEIITMDLRDIDALVIGLPPLLGNLVLLSEDEVEAVTIEAEGSQPTPEIAADGNPMLWVPIRASER